MRSRDFVSWFDGIEVRKTTWADVVYEYRVWARNYTDDPIFRKEVLKQWCLLVLYHRQQAEAQANV